MAVQNAAVIWLIIAAVVGIILLIATYVANRNKKKNKKGVSRQPDQPDNVREVGGGGARRRGRTARSLMTSRRAQDDDEDEDDYEGTEGYSMGLDSQLPVGKIGAKKQRKLEMKEEKRQLREQMEAEREDKKQREALREEERKRHEERRRREEERQEEEERKRKEEQELKEHEEYLLLKEQFTVEEEGVGETAEESEALLEEFVNYIKTNKVVLLEELACQFGLRTQDAIDRLQALQEMERLTGVTDDRGKFIYISPEELQAVAKFIKQRGRVTISELAESSNTLINLQTDKTRTDSTAMAPVTA